MDRPEPDPRAWDDVPRDMASADKNTDVADMSEPEFDAWSASLPSCRDLPSAPEEIAAADARALAGIAAGQVYPHSVVSAWLKTWGDSDCKPFREWLKSSG